MKTLAFAASNSIKSINKQLVAYAATLLNDHEVEILDINDYEMPIYSTDLEEANGIPAAASNFLEKLNGAEALIISYAEHNGNYTAAYKNLFDWASRANRDVYQGKSIVMLAASPGPGGAQSVLALAKQSAHFFNGHVAASMSIPSFFENFDQETQEITNPELVSMLKTALQTIQKL